MPKSMSLSLNSRHGNLPHRGDRLSMDSIFSTFSFPCRQHQERVLRTCSSHQTCMRMSSVSSGWKLVPIMLPCLTATMSLSSPPWTSVVLSTALPFTLFFLSGKTARISTSAFSGFPLRTVTPGSTESTVAPGANSCSTMGARMKTPGNGAAESEPVSMSDCARNGKWTSATKLSI